MSDYSPELFFIIQDVEVLNGSSVGGFRLFCSK
jgi:hypothetical protein